MLKSQTVAEKTAKTFRGPLFSATSCRFHPCPPIDSIITLMTVWGITGKIIRTTIVLITDVHV